MPIKIALFFAAMTIALALAGRVGLVDPARIAWLLLVLPLMAVTVIVARDGRAGCA